MLHRKIYQALIDAAKRQETLTHSDVAPLAGLRVTDEADRDKLSQILGIISTYEHQQGRPMLSAVVIHGGYRVPGRGFFQLVRHLGLLTAKSDQHEPLFWHEELKRVYEAWKA